MPQPPRLRPVAGDDVDAVLALNERNVTALAPMDAARLEQLRGWADRFDVLEVEGSFAGFVVTFGPGSPYDSGFYSWFEERYDDFYYLDRIVLHEDFRRRGLGSLVYDEIEQRAGAHGRLTLEVNIRPCNEGSLAFHGGRGFCEVGVVETGTKAVAMMEKVL